MSAGNRTATVETLAAEVRVLMVGSRQVTLSVYSQLDYADLDQIEPFGRVRPRQMDLDYVYLVGRHKITGELARCRVPAGESSISEELEKREYDRAFYEATARAKRAEADVNRYEQWEREHDHPDHDHSRCYATELQTARDKAAAARTEAGRLRAQYDKLADPLRREAASLVSLPLIVLAGLR